jgi:RsiW-degrading membrane proteinase PrsW (M82 family)
MSQNEMPPIPRDHDQASMSELIPIRSSRINLKKSPLVIFVVVTAVITILSFGFLGPIIEGRDLQSKQSAFSNFALLMTFYLLLVVLLIVYLYSKSDKAIWSYFLNMIFVCVLLATPLGAPYFLVFRGILPGGSAWTGATSFVPAFIGMFFGAGMMEELMKITLVLVGALFTMKAAQIKPVLPPIVFNALRIRGPLDGLVMGIFGGAGFILIETWGQYVPNMVAAVFRGTQGNDLGAFGAGLMLLFPRVTGGMVGHMAWAGITGYFIGLAVLRPSQAPKLFLIGWVGASLLHAVWNTQNFVPLFGWASALASGVMVVACLLKARQLEASIGRSVDTYGSVLVDPPSASMSPRPATTPQAVPMPPPAAAWTPTPASVSPFAAALPQQPATRPIQQAPMPSGLALSLPGASVPLVPGSRIDLGSYPGLGPSAQGVVCEVTQHPTRPDVLGLKNLGAQVWQVRLRDGSRNQLEPQRNLRLAVGVQIDFGAGLQAVVMQL